MAHLHHLGERGGGEGGGAERQERRVRERGVLFCGTPFVAAAGRALVSLLH
jgi:hypothetical protein